MKLVLSRKGFDSAAGKAPSPIVDGRPVSMPIPATKNSATSYDHLGLGDLVERVTRGRVPRTHLCHHDPMFADGECIFGQTGAAQSHLARNLVGPGDVFLFFGLFSDEETHERHHRVFGYMRVKSRSDVSSLPTNERRRLQGRGHPHVTGSWPPLNVVYSGEGTTARRAHPGLRLTRDGGPLSQWTVPPWLQDKGLTYHGKAGRWSVPGELSVVARGQEFVCDVGDDPEALAWTEDVIGLISS